MGGGGMGSGNGTRSSMHSGGPGGLGGGNNLRGSNNPTMRPGGSRSLGSNSGMRGNSFNRSDRMPMGRGGDQDRSSAPLGSSGGNSTYGRR